MIEPYGEIVEQHYQSFRNLGFNLVKEDDYSAILQAKRVRIALSVEQYITSDIMLNFIDKDGSQYPLWMVRLQLDMENYDNDRRALCEIKDKYGLRDGSRGKASYAAGVRCYAIAYLEQATRFLREYLPRINVEGADFKEYVGELECH